MKTDRSRVSRSILRVVAATAFGLAAASANAAQIILDPTNTSVIPGVAAFETNGDGMVGMSVTAIFVDGGSETVFWTATGVDAGAAIGTAWRIDVVGDTFAVDAWAADFERAISVLIFDGRPGLTLFDRTDDSGFVGQGTPGSASGRDFATNLVDDDLIVATYSEIVAVGANPPVGDLWHVLTVDFAALPNGGAIGQFLFSQDTDNDARIQVPEPAGLGLFGLALVGLALWLRRRVTVH